MESFEPALSSNPNRGGRSATATVPTVLAVLFILAFALLCWFALRPAMLAQDWVGWRQTDTQTIARHLAEPGASFLYPRINWGGTGPGYVETEMQLYTALIAPFIRVFGDVEWPGQLVSLVSVALGAWVLFRSLRGIHGEWAALFGVVAYLSTPVTIYVGTSVQPEALCLLLFLCAWSSFLRYESSGRLLDLGLYALFGALAMLVKPTAAQLGVASFVTLALRSRSRLRAPATWLAWVFMLGALGVFMWHAQTLFRDYGNTFGVLSGGDSKLLKMRQLLLLGTYRLAATTIFVYGFGFFGTAALLWCLWKRRMDAAMWGLLAGNALWTLVALRYVCNLAWGGIHYSIISAVLAGYCAASAYGSVAAASGSNWLRRAAVALAVVTLGFSLQSRFRARSLPNSDAANIIAAGHKLAQIVPPGEVVVVRSPAVAFDTFWQTPNNYQDPRVFYLAKVRGWALGRDEEDPLMVERYAQLGARYYIEPGHGWLEHPIDGWLAEHARLVATTELGGRIFSLNR